MALYRNCKISTTDGFHFNAVLPGASRPFRPLHDQEYFDLGGGYFEPVFDIDAEDMQDRRHLLEDNFGVNLETCRRFGRGDVFDELFDSALDLSADERFSFLVEGILPFFDGDRDQAELYVQRKLANKSRASRARSLRFKRKAFLNRFSYYCTFTYDDKKCTWEEFNRQIRIYFMNKHNREGWKVMMVPEFGKKNGRFHLHAVVAVPKTSCLPGKMTEYKRYNTEKRKLQIVHENSYFARRWGFNDWQLLSDMNEEEMRHSVGYVIKYLGKTDLKAFYSRGIPTLLQGDVNSKDILIDFGRQGMVLLYPGWHLWAHGQDLGQYSYGDHFRSFAVTG